MLKSNDPGAPPGMSKLTLAASQLYGMSSGGILSPITLGSNLSMSGSTLDAANSSSPIPEQGRWSARQVILTPTLAWEGVAVMQPCVLYEGGIFKMWYQGSTSSALGYATSSDGINWSKSSSPQIASGIVCPNVIKVGSTYFLYYSNWTSPGIEVRYSSDGINWGASAACFAVPPSGITNYGNSTVWKEGTQNWYMIFDTLRTADNYWLPMYATSTDGLSWVVVNSPLTTLEVFSGGSAGSMHVNQADPKCGSGAYQGWYLVDTGRIGNTNIYRAYSYDRQNWSIVTPNPILTHTGTGWEITQIADPWPIEVNGVSYLFVDAVNSGVSPQTAAIEVVTFNGTLNQIVTGT